MAKSVVVAGVGGNIGSHLMASLARMPEIGRVALIDRDSYEGRNSANQAILPGDVGELKVVVQARRLQEIRPSLEVRAIHASLETLPLAVWRADLVVGCLDSRAARQAVNGRVWRLGVPWADAGVLGSEWLARVNVYLPAADAPCLECAWSDADYRLLEQQYPCGGSANAPAPNGASAELGALAAAMLALECRKILAGEFGLAAVGRQVTLNARWHHHSVTQFRCNPQCRFDHATWSIEPLACNLGETRVADLLELAERVRVPGQRFVACLRCPICGRAKKLFHLDCSIDAGVRQCGKCQRPMAASGFDVFESLDKTLPVGVQRLALGDAGLRYGDVIRAGDRHFEMVANSVIATRET